LLTSDELLRHEECCLGVIAVSLVRKSSLNYMLQEVEELIGLVDVRREKVWVAFVRLFC
jgi:hypothetical protein